MEENGDGQVVRLGGGMEQGRYSWRRMEEDEYLGAGMEESKVEEDGAELELTWRTVEGRYSGRRGWRRI